ncbi:YitT family protein [uncultured Desulfuromusa sp.]|uniref:YitT family protein n=1 Tax=uncultured Desulfuromusa sp. TaxID=219183 RepID=UPI002AA7E848|nr:YitT family protein [uncultured Desulfuromusa sp.]
MSDNKRKFVYSVFWNCGLIIVGSVIQTIVLKGIAAPHQFIPGGLFGIASLLHYLTHWLNPGLLYLLLNIPMFILGYLFVSRRFLWYSGLSMLVVSLTYQFINIPIQIENQLYAAIAFGAVLGVGSGIVLRSFGSNGGADVLAIILYQKYNLGIGKFSFFFNMFLYIFCFFSMPVDLVIASMIAVFITAQTIDYTLSLFSQRKLVFIISPQAEDIADQVMNHLKIGTTLVPAVGAYRREAKTVLMVVINNIQLKRLEEIVFTVDEHALFIVENTFNVLGSTFSKRKLY